MNNNTKNNKYDQQNTVKKAFEIYSKLEIKEKDDFVNAFGALNYAHGWIDSGVRLGIFNVYDDKLFTVK